MDRFFTTAGVSVRTAFLCFLTALLSLSAGSCGTLSRRVEIRTAPPGAEVFSMKGEKVGTTPFVLEHDILERLTHSNRVEFKVIASGYAEREVALDIHGDDQHDIQLTRYDAEYFRDRLLKDYSNQANPMVREALRIQGLLVLRKIEDAEKALTEFTVRYPNLSAGYVLLANVEHLRNNEEKARGYLLRAKSLDPEDPVVLRMLGMTPSPGSASMPVPVASPTVVPTPSPSPLPGGNSP